MILSNKTLICAVLWGCTNALAQVNTLGLLSAKDTGFSGQIGLNFEGARGNNNYLKYGLNSRLDWNLPKLQNFVVGDYQLGQSGKSFETYLRKGFVHGRGIWHTYSYVSPEIYAQGELNDALKLKYRALCGGGMRLGPLETQSDSLKIALGGGSGLMYEIEKYNTAKIPNARNHYFARLRTSHYLSVEAKLGAWWNFNMGAYYQPNTMDFHDFRILINAKFAVKIWQNLRLNQKFNTRYDAKTISNSIEPWDYDLNTGLEWTF